MPLFLIRHGQASLSTEKGAVTGYFSGVSPAALAAEWRSCSEITKPFVWAEEFRREKVGIRWNRKKNKSQLHHGKIRWANAFTQLAAYPCNGTARFCAPNALLKPQWLCYEQAAFICACCWLGGAFSVTQWKWVCLIKKDRKKQEAPSPPLPKPSQCRGSCIFLYGFHFVADNGCVLLHERVPWHSEKGAF